MNLKEINETLFAQAKELKMCDAVHKAWYNKIWDADALADVMYRNLDFCIDHRWPAKETFIELFSADERHRNGIVADEQWSLLNQTFAIVIGSSKAKARYNAFNVGKIYVFDDSTCEITVKGHASVSIHIYDTASVDVTAQDSAHVLVVRHSKRCRCYGKGQMTFKECT